MKGRHNIALWCSKIGIENLLTHKIREEEGGSLSKTHPLPSSELSIHNWEIFIRFFLQKDANTVNSMENSLASTVVSITGDKETRNHSISS